MRKWLLVLLAGLVATMAWVSPANAADGAPVVDVHGIVGQGAGCTAVDSAKQAAPLQQVLSANGYIGQVVPIDYYCGDSKGVSIRGAGGPSTAEYPQNGYTLNTPIERLGLDLASFVYDTYTVKGQPVNLACYSMGGLICTYALTHLGTPGFPPSLLVQNVVTFSTPFGGVDKSNFGTPEQYKLIWCGNYTQCDQLMPGSPFLTDLAQQSLPAGVDLTTLGGGPNDIMTYAASTTALAQHAVNFYGSLPVKYNHNNMITDTSLAFNMPARVTQRGGGTSQIYNGAHSLNWAAHAFVSSAW